MSYQVEAIRNGACYAVLEAVSPPRVDAKLDADIKMSMAGEFLFNPGIDYLKDKLRMVLDGNVVGEFWVAAMEKITTATGSVHVQLECYDGCYILKSTRAEEMIYCAKNTNYLAAIQALLIAAGVQMILATDSEAQLDTDHEWDIGTDYLTIVNELLQEINYRGVWFNAAGYAVLEPDEAPTAADIAHRYGPSAIESPIRLPASSEQDLWDAPNVFILICDNADKTAPMKATAVNENPLSPMSTFRRGRRIARVIKVKNVANQTALQKMADTTCFNSMLLSEVAEVDVRAEAGHGIGDVVAANHPLVSGIWRETAWSLTPGKPMHCTWQRMILQ